MTTLIASAMTTAVSAWRPAATGPLTPRLSRPDAARPLRTELQYLGTDTRVVPHCHLWGQVAESATGCQPADRGRFFAS